MTHHIIDTISKVKLLDDVLNTNEQLYFDVDVDRFCLPPQSVSSSTSTSTDDLHIVFISVGMTSRLNTVEAEDIFYSINVCAIGIPDILKRYLENPKTVKIVYDIHHYVDILHRQYGINLVNIRCLRVTHLEYLSISGMNTSASVNILKNPFQKRKFTAASYPYNIYFILEKNIRALISIDKDSYLPHVARQRVLESSQRVLNKSLFIDDLSELNDEQMCAYKACCDRNLQLIFITGAGGSGKSFLIHKFSTYCQMNDINLALTAPTGIAAITIKGMTLTSLFKIPTALIELDQIWNREYKRFIPNNKLQWNLKDEHKNYLKKIDILLIDEISMVNYQLIEIVDYILRYIHNKIHIAFGGVKLITVGDYFQLAPVPISYTDTNGVQPFKSTVKYCFQYPPLSNIKIFNLSRIYRQHDKEFLDILNDARYGSISNNKLNKCKISYSEVENKYSDYTILYASNKQKDIYNSKMLNKLPGPVVSYKSKEVVYNSTLTSHSNYYTVIPQLLHLKVDAYVMCIKNDAQNGLVNGDVGYVKHLSRDGISVIVYVYKERLLSHVLIGKLELIMVN
jgi:nucleoside-triphosphatase THEP1